MNKWRVEKPFLKALLMYSKTKSARIDEFYAFCRDEDKNIFMRHEKNVLTWSPE